MNGSNFNWFLHTMLFMHTTYIIKKQKAKEKVDEDNSEDEAEIDVEDEV